jgi:release factor glutamine methyltransferase
VKLKQALARARRIMADNSIEDPSLEGELLLRHVLGIDRTQLYLELERDFNPTSEEILSRLIERRLQGEPSFYIIGHREFYGIDFYVNHDVLIPRPESELLVEKALMLARNNSISTIADIGTGCGAIAISLALNLPGVKIYATDISAKALEVAGTNCRKHGVAGRICFLQGDMLEPLPGPVDLIIANLPYVRESDLPGIGPLSFEPALALNGGPDGVTEIEKLCHQVGEKLRRGGVMFLEIGQGQAGTVTGILRRIFPSARIDVSRDFAGFERVVSLRLTQGRF